MPVLSLEETIRNERDRLLREIDRRGREIPKDRDARWQPSQQWLINERRYVAAARLKRCGVFPVHSTKCLEIGFGYGGWLPDLLSWGVHEENLYGIDLSERCVNATSKLLPSAKLSVGDAADLPWNDGTFALVISSTVFTSILNDEVRKQVAKEIQRVLVPGGALLWYDFRYNNPNNPHVRKVSREELKLLFRELAGEIRMVSLAPPLLRAVILCGRVPATLLSTIPFLRTHLIAVLKKQK